METFNAEDMYHMFDARSATDEIAYVKNTISYPDFLLKFINDDNYRVNSNVDKWSDMGEYFKKVFSINSIKDNIENLYAYRKSLYIYNSLRMANEKSFDLYRSAKRMRKDSYIYDAENIQLLIFFDNDSINSYLRNIGSELVSITNLSDTLSLTCGDLVLEFQEGSTVVVSPDQIKLHGDMNSHIYLSIMPVFNKNNKTDCLM